MLRNESSDELQVLIKSLDDSLAMFEMRFLSKKCKILLQD